MTPSGTPGRHPTKKSVSKVGSCGVLGGAWGAAAPNPGGSGGPGAWRKTYSKVSSCEGGSPPTRGDRGAGAPPENLLQSKNFRGACGAATPQPGGLSGGGNRWVGSLRITVGPPPSPTDSSVLEALGKTDSRLWADASDFKVRFASCSKGPCRVVDVLLLSLRACSGPPLCSLQPSMFCLPCSFVLFLSHKVTLMRFEMSKADWPEFPTLGT